MSEQRQPDEVIPSPEHAARRFDYPDESVGTTPILGRGCAWTLCWTIVGLWALALTAGVLADMV